MELNIETLNLIVQTTISLFTLGALISALWSNAQNKRQFDIEVQRVKDQELRNQAEKIAVWFEEDAAFDDVKHADQYSIPRGFIVSNNSGLPIYNVIISEVGLVGAGPPIYGEMRGNFKGEYYSRRTLFATLPPGLWGQVIGTDGGGMHVRTSLEIAFTDARGNNWIRRGNGQLDRVLRDTLALYSIPLPAEYAEPIRPVQFHGE